METLDVAVKPKKRFGRAERKVFDADDMHWYAIDVVRQKEFVVGRMFERRGCVTFIPTEMRFRKKSRYTKGKLEIALPALSGTVFVGFPTAPDWFRVMNMNLVNGVLSVDDKPRRIDTASRQWIDYRSNQVDGRLVLERHKVKIRFEGEEVEVERTAAFVQVQGRGIVRPTWQLKQMAASDRPVVISAKGERLRQLAPFLTPNKNLSPQPVLAAA